PRYRTVQFELRLVTRRARDSTGGAPRSHARAGAPRCSPLGAVGEQFERTPRGPWHRWQSGASAESVSASMRAMFSARVTRSHHSLRLSAKRRHKRDERARWSAVVPLALEKGLFLNASCRCLLVPLLGKKCCDINNRLTSF